LANFLVERKNLLEEDGYIHMRRMWNVF